MYLLVQNLDQKYIELVQWVLNHRRCRLSDYNTGGGGGRNAPESVAGIERNMHAAETVQFMVNIDFLSAYISVTCWYHKSIREPGLRHHIIRHLEEIHVPFLRCRLIFARDTQLNIEIIWSRQNSLIESLFFLSVPGCCFLIGPFWCKKHQVKPKKQG